MGKLIVSFVQDENGNRFKFYKRFVELNSQIYNNMTRVDSVFAMINSYDLYNTYGDSIIAYDDFINEDGPLHHHSAWMHKEYKDIVLPDGYEIIGFVGSYIYIGDKDGSIFFIAFDSSKTYKNDKENDTTKKYEATNIYEFSKIIPEREYFFTKVSLDTCIKSGKDALTLAIANAYHRDGFKIFAYDKIDEKIKDYLAEKIKPYEILKIMRDVIIRANKMESYDHHDLYDLNRIYTSYIEDIANLYKATNLDANYGLDEVNKTLDLKLRKN